MEPTIRVRVARDGDWAEVKSLILHPMETGLRKDPATGTTVPRHHITRVTYTLNDRPIMVAHCSTAVAKNPWLTFSFRGAATGDRFTVEWVDNLGESDSLDQILD